MLDTGIQNNLFKEISTQRITAQDILDKFRLRTQTFENGIKMAWHIYIYMSTSRHFYVIFDIRVFDLNVPIKTTKRSQDKETFLSIHILQHFLDWKIVLR